MSIDDSARRVLPLSAAEPALRLVADALPSHVWTAASDGAVGFVNQQWIDYTGLSREQRTIRPFQVNVPETELVELRRRVKATRWPEREPVPDASQGVQLAMIQKLADYRATEYDWRLCEARLAALPHFVTEIDGLDIHFIHVRSKHDNALPLIVTHGWPGSIVEQMKITTHVAKRVTVMGITTHRGSEAPRTIPKDSRCPGASVSRSHWQPKRIPGLGLIEVHETHPRALSDMRRMSQSLQSSASCR